MKDSLARAQEVMRKERERQANSIDDELNSGLPYPNGKAPYTEGIPEADELAAMDPRDAVAV